MPTGSRRSPVTLILKGQSMPLPGRMLQEASVHTPQTKQQIKKEQNRKPKPKPRSFESTVKTYRLFPLPQ